MKYPTHSITDLSTSFSSRSSQYWIFNYINKSMKSIKIFDDLTFYKKFLLKKETIFAGKIMLNQKKNTIKYNLSNSSIFLSNHTKSFYRSFFETRIKVKHRVFFSKHETKEIYDYLINADATFDKKLISRLIRNFKFNPDLNSFLVSNLWALFDINFLRKEKLYTKLKYSRVPQYDIASGGVAALFAGLLGFLICEKFGFELLDSGDFYYFFIYVVFFVFSVRLYFKVSTETSSINEIVSLKWLFFFYRTIFTLFLNSIKIRLFFFL